MRKTTMLIACAATFATLSAAPAFAGQCRDPWITQAIREVTGREPNGSNETGECTYTQYGGGRWSSYPQLKGYVQNKFRPSLPTANLGSNSFATQGQTVRIPPSQVQQYRYVGSQRQFLYNGKWYALIGNDGSTLIGNDVGGLVGNDGASLR